MHEIAELTKEEEWREALSILRELRPELEIDATLEKRASLMASGYAMYGLRVQGKIVSVAGAVTHPHITRDIDFWVVDLVTASEYRSQGLGAAMMRFLEDRASALGSSRLLVHTRFARERAQGFYDNHLGYERYAVVFNQKLT